MDLVIRNIQSQQDLNLFKELAKRLGLSTEAFLKEGHESIAEERKKLILVEREQYLKGEGKSFNWEEVKKYSLNKSVV